MKRVLILLALFVYSGTALLRAQEYQDLASLWVDQKYHKLTEKAVKYTENDKHKNHPLPYLYAAKALYRISLDEKLRSASGFEKAESDALNYAVKYTKKDKNGTYKKDADLFFSEMKKTYFEQTENYYDEGNLKKVMNIIKKVVQFDPESAGCWLIKGICEFELKNKAEAVKNIDLGVSLVSKCDFNNMYEVDQNFMRYALMAYTNYLIKTKDRTNAKKIINLGYQYYSKVKDENDEPIPGNQQYVDLYNSLING